MIILTVHYWMGRGRWDVWCFVCVGGNLMCVCVCDFGFMSGSDCFKSVKHFVLQLWLYEKCYINKDWLIDWLIKSSHTRQLSDRLYLFLWSRKMSQGQIQRQLRCRNVHFLHSAVLWNIYSTNSRRLTRCRSTGAGILWSWRMLK